MSLDASELKGPHRQGQHTVCELTSLGLSGPEVGYFKRKVVERLSDKSFPGL